MRTFTLHLEDAEQYFEEDGMFTLSWNLPNDVGDSDDYVIGRVELPDAEIEVTHIREE